MTDKLLCPFCQRDMERDGYQIQCRDRDCREEHDMYGSYNLWQALIDTKKKLDMCVNALKKLSLGNIPSLPDDETLALAMCNYARDTLKQIKDKEQQ